jgi:small-conductance mechanosensitive channel
MFRTLLLTTALASGAVYVGAHAAADPWDAPWWHGQALKIMALAFPETACQIDQYACLQRQDEKLANLKNDADATLRDLVDKQRSVGTAEAEARNRAHANDTLLEEGRGLWLSQASLGHAVTWVGVTYQPIEFRAQLESLFRERGPLQQAAERLGKANAELNDRAIGMAAVRDKIAADRATLAAKLALARAGALTGALTETLAEADRIVDTANEQFKEAANSIAGTLRTTDELKNDAAKLAEPSNPEFDAFLAGGRPQ